MAEPNQALQPTAGAAVFTGFDGSFAPAAAELGRSAAGGDALRKYRCLIPLSAAVVLAAMGCGSSTKNIPGDSIIREADRVEVFRVGSEPAASGAGEAIGGYPILATGKELGADFAARLSKVLRGGGVTRNQKKCGLEPGVAYRLWSGDRAVEVLVCFNCDVLWPHVVGSQAAAPHHEWQDFDPARAELLALTKEAFPDDAEVQGLPERRN